MTKSDQLAGPDGVKFSVLMANFNQGRFIRDAILSVIDQTYENWELIICDDCSTDDSVKICQEFAAAHNIRILVNNHNMGVGYTKNRAFQTATGELCGILDSDDLLEPRALEVMARAHVDNPKVGIIQSRNMICDELMNVRFPESHAAVGMYDQRYGRMRTGHFQTLKRENLKEMGGIDPTLPAAEDIDFFLKLEENGGSMIVEEILYRYRVNPSGITRTLSRERIRKAALVAYAKAEKRRKGRDDIRRFSFVWRRRYSSETIFLEASRLRTEGHLYQAICVWSAGLCDCLLSRQIGPWLKFGLVTVSRLPRGSWH